MLSLLIGQFNNYVTLKLSFLIHAPPHHHVLSRLFTRTLSRYVTLNTNTPSPPPNKKRNFIGFKKDRSGSKEISFLFHVLFFQLSTNNTKKKAFESETKALSTLQSTMERNKKSYKTCYFGLHIPYMQSFL